MWLYVHVLYITFYYVNIFYIYIIHIFYDATPPKTNMSPKKGTLFIASEPTKIFRGHSLGFRGSIY